MNSAFISLGVTAEHLGLFITDPLGLNNSWILEAQPCVIRRKVVHPVLNYCDAMRQWSQPVSQHLHDDARSLTSSPNSQTREELSTRWKYTFYLYWTTSDSWLIFDTSWICTLRLLAVSVIFQREEVFPATCHLHPWQFGGGAHFWKPINFIFFQKSLINISKQNISASWTVQP